MKPSVSKLLQLIPPLSPTLHKGQAGRVGVLGGSVDYAGAPYYSAMSAMRLGADMTFVVSDSRSAGTIQSFSPDLIVLPYLHPEQSGSLESDMEAVKGLFPRIHSLIVGPGLSRNEALLDRAAEIIQLARDKDMPVVIDADGLYLIQQRPDLVKGNQRAVLTPNVVEFKRLCKALGVEEKEEKDEWGMARRLSEALGGVTIVQKGPSDMICNEKHHFKADNDGGLKRCGGQGDVLSGILGTTLAWGHYSIPTIRKLALDKGDKSLEGPSPLPAAEVTPLAAYLACTLVRECSRRAFDQHGRAMQTSDMLDHIGETLVQLEQSKL